MPIVFADPVTTEAAMFVSRNSREIKLTERDIGEDAYRRASLASSWTTSAERIVVLIVHLIVQHLEDWETVANVSFHEVREEPHDIKI